VKFPCCVLEEHARNQMPPTAGIGCKPLNVMRLGVAISADGAVCGLQYAAIFTRA
jgi:hypothetical protein